MLPSRNSEAVFNGVKSVFYKFQNTNTKLPFDVAQKIPFSKFDVEVLKVDTKKDYVIICNKGILSYTATQNLKNK